MSHNNAKSVEGGEEARDKIHGWLSKYSGDPDVEEGFKIVLYRDAKAGEVEVGSYTFDLSKPIAESVVELVDEIVNDSEEDALSRRGKNKYQVKIAGRKSKVIFALHIISDFENDIDFEDFDAELPNARGIVGQTMRHSEVFAKEMVKAATGDRNFTQDMIRDLRDENLKLKQQWFEGQKLIEELRSMQFARDMEIDKYKKSEARKDDGMKLLKMLGPNIVQKFLGGGQSAVTEMGGRSPPEMMVEGLLESLEDEQKAKIVEILNPIQMNILMELHKFSEDRKAREAEMQAQAQAQLPFGQVSTQGPQQGPYPPPSPFSSPIPPRQPNGASPPYPFQGR